MAVNIQARSEPIEGDLLWLQALHRHRSYALFHGECLDATIKARRSDKKLWDHVEALPNEQINENVFNHIRAAGFGGLFRTGFHRLDHALVTALVERWRPETHTFHFPIGEATITLQDVQVLWGLPIDGPAVTGHWMSMGKGQWIVYCAEWLGFQPLPDDVNGGKIKMTTLIRQLEEPFAANEVAYQQRARVYILALIGGHLFVDSSQNEVSLNFIQNLQDLSRGGRKSWGSAVLAFLYRNLCCAAENFVSGIQGALVLLQYWAWARMPHITPRIKDGGGYNYEDCYARWNFDMTYLDVPRNVLVTYRSAFTALRNDQFLWTPYDAILHSLPPDCHDGLQIWRYSGWLIFWSTVEPILTHRVVRQFGFTQHIPHPATPTHTVDVYDSNKGVYKVTSSYERNGEGEYHYTVKFGPKKCTCGRWQNQRLPCSHAIAACGHRGIDADKMLSNNYRTNRWRNQYNVALSPLRDVVYWGEATWRIQADSSKLITHRGRRRSRRFQNEMDENHNNQTRTRQPARCGICNEVGHNRNSCSNRR